MTRHRSPRGRDAQAGRRREPRTVPVVLAEDAVRGAARHRSRTRSAVRHGAVAAGLTGSALAFVGPAVLALPEQDAETTLELSAQGVPVADASPATSAAGAVAPVSRPAGAAAAADLIKATERDRAAAQAQEEAASEAQREARAQPAAAEDARTLTCGASGSYGGVADSVQEVGNAMECVFPGHDVLGVGSRGNTSDHPGGYALDFMTTPTATRSPTVRSGNADALGISYVIWNQRTNTGSGWERMEDRGGPTANHEDHVHLSFRHGDTPDVSVLRTCR